MRIPTSGLAGFTVVLALAFVGLGRVAEAQEGSTYQIIAFTGQPDPTGGTYNDFQSPTVGSDGTVGFIDFYSGDTFTARVFAGQPGAFHLVATTGQVAPGTGSGIFNDFINVSVSKNGLAAFTGEVGGAQHPFTGVWAETATGLTLAVFADESDSLSVSDLGQVGFRSGLVGVKGELSPDDSFGALLFGNPGALNAALEDGQTLGAYQLNTIYDTGDSELSVGPYVDVNESGNVALKVGVEGPSASPTPGPTPGPVEAVYAGSPSAPTPVAIQDQASGLSGFAYSDFDQKPTISSNGYVAFSAYLEASDDSSGGPNQAVFAGSPGAIVPVVTEGATVPTTADVTFENFTNAVVNAAGDVVFGAQIRYSNESSRQGIWLKRKTDSSAVLIAVDGMTLPTPTGTAEVSSVSFAGPGTFNDLYEFVFKATFADGTQGLYVADTRPGAPTISIAAPAKPRERVTMASKIVVAGTASDDTGVAKVEYTVAHEASADKRGEGKHRRLITSRVKLAKGATNWKFNVPLTMGLNLISVTATDKLGNVSPAYKIRVLRYACPAN